MSSENQIIIPNWPAPDNIYAYSTTRLGGSSAPPYQGLNLGDHVGDDPSRVQQNRQQLSERLALPTPPLWLNQVHGVMAHHLITPLSTPVAADASYSSQPGMVCTVMTADCLPLLLCDRAGTQVAAIHAGWRGLCDGVIEHCVKAMGLPPQELLVWLGPAIGPAKFEVGAEVRAAFIEAFDEAHLAFLPQDKDHWLADIYLLARQRLQRIGVEAIYGGDCCTYSDERRFYSYRRDGVTGRMASLIYRS